jgi:paraquat-inducible protein B
MKRPMFALAALLATTLSVPLNVLAGPDALQKQLLQRLKESERTLEQAEKAKDQEQQKLMREHMRMMEESMKMMMAMKPRKGMTMKEHEEWIAQHQKIMEQMMGQMMKDQELMMHLSK